MVTHCDRVAICPAESFFLGGISNCFQRTASMIRLLSASPGTSAAPESPPLIAATRESSLSPPCNFFELEL